MVFLCRIQLVLLGIRLTRIRTHRFLSAIAWEMKVSNYNTFSTVLEIIFHRNPMVWDMKNQNFHNFLSCWQKILRWILIAFEVNEKLKVIFSLWGRNTVILGISTSPSFHKWFKSFRSHIFTLIDKSQFSTVFNFSGGGYTAQKMFSMKDFFRISCDDFTWYTPYPSMLSLLLTWNIFHIFF